MLRTALSLLLVLLLAPLAPGAASHAAEASGVFATPDATFLAEVGLSSVCRGEATLTLTLTPVEGGDPTTRTVTGTLFGYPTPCDWACAPPGECAGPFDWTFRGHDGDVLLVATGLSGNGEAWTVTGPFQEGYLHGVAARGGGCGNACILADGSS